MQTAADFGLGYPRRTVLHRCIVEGPAASAPTKKDSEPVPAEIEAVEAALNRVPPRDKRLAILIYAQKKDVPSLRRYYRVSREIMDDMIARMHNRVESEIYEPSSSPTA